MTSGIRGIAITGASGYIGGQLIRHLDGLDSVDHILATDIRPPRQQYSSKVVFVQHDVTLPMDDLFREHGVEAVAHLAFVLNPDRQYKTALRINVHGAMNVMQSCVLGDVRHLVYLSSTTVYGAHPDNPALLTEESPVRPVKGFRYGETKASADLYLQGDLMADAACDVSILRSCPILGPNADNFVAQSFSRTTLVGIRGFDPPMQFIHEDDMVAVLAHCLLNKVNGIYNVGGDGAVAWDEMARLAGKRLLRIPAPLLYGLTSLTWALRLQNSSPASGLNFIRYPFLASTEKLEREHGLKAKYTSRDAWEAFVASRNKI